MIDLLKQATPGEIPTPGQQVAGSVVVASVYYREAGDNTIPEHMRDELHNTDLYTILLLNDAPPYYTVGTGYWDGAQWKWDGQPVNHENIVPAVNGDRYLGNESNRTGKSGYTDMGGDY